jgi:putative FmdB family regulatory protein
MPLYEYECQGCSNRFEVRQRVVDEPVSVCPSCGGPTKRLFHPVGIIFKGSGWYVTDSRKSDSSNASTTSEKSSDSSTSAAKDASSTTSSEKSSSESKSTTTTGSNP